MTGGLSPGWAWGTEAWMRRGRRNIPGRRNGVCKSTKVPSHLAPVRAGERPVAGKQKAGARVFGVEFEEAGCTGQVLASFIGDGQGLLFILIGGERGL